MISVGQYTYLAMPRGAITDDHVLICPIDCVPSRLHLSLGKRTTMTLFAAYIHLIVDILRMLDAKQELLKFVRCLEMYYDKIGCAMIMFERAIRTKSGRDHMQVQCIGIPKGKVVRAEEIFHSKAEQNGLHFHQVKDGQSVDDTVMNMEGGPFQEYFYVELPMSSGRRSLVYVQENDSISFPMQFGNEVTYCVYQLRALSPFSNPHPPGNYSDPRMPRTCSLEALPAD